jgi:zeaxanthin glucosyltransferase
VARALIATYAGAGHVHPLLGVARTLRGWGWQVGWLPLLGALPPSAISLGVTPLALPAEANLTDDEWRAAADHGDPDAFPRAVLELFRRQVPFVEEVVRRFAPDVAACNGDAYQAVIAVERAGRPWVMISPNLRVLARPGFASPETEAWGRQAAARDRLFAGYGVAPRLAGLTCLSELANVVFAPEALRPLAPPVPRLVLAGPSIDHERERGEALPADALAPAGEGGARRIAYVAFGSGYGTPTIPASPVLERAVRGADAAGLRTLVSTGHASPPEGLPASVCAQARWPQLAVLARADVFVTHGGANSVMEALSCGVPMLVVPLHHDNHLNGQIVTELGAGAVLPEERVEVEAVRARLAELADPDGRARRAARELAAAYRAANGAVRAAEILRDAAGAA